MILPFDTIAPSITYANKKLLKMAVWNVALCSLVNNERRFRNLTASIISVMNDIPQESHLHTCRRENLKFYLKMCC
jgi:hypothetical protein